MLKSFIRSDTAVAIAGYLLEIVGAIGQQSPTAVANFYWAFLGVGLISMSSALWMWRLPRNAGAEMAGRGGANRAAESETSELRAT